jgi:hypothetical protein
MVGTVGTVGTVGMVVSSGFLLRFLFFRVSLGTVGMVRTVGVARKVSIPSRSKLSRSNQCRFRSSRADPTNLDSDPTTPIQATPVFAG